MAHERESYAPLLVPSLLILLISLSSMAIPVYAVSSSPVQNAESSGLSTGSVSVPNSLSVMQDANVTGEALTLGWLTEDVPADARVTPVYAAGALPIHFDWRSNSGSNWMTSVKNQGGCGSCVAFGAVGATEAQFKIAANNPGWNVDLSEQHLFSCGGGQCGYGWYISAALNRLRDYGTPDEACFPYQARDASCSGGCADWQSRALKIASWSWVANNPSALEAALMNGPLVAGFNVYTDFFSYSGGIYHHTSGSLAGGHAITIVGYDSNERYWIVKNSWGASWGENGYFRIGFGEAGIENYVASIRVSANGSPTVTGLTPDKVSPQVIGSTVVWTASASDTDGDPIQYKFQVQADSGAWVVTQGWSSSNVWSWTPSAAGMYSVSVWVRDGKHADPSGFDAQLIVNSYSILSAPPNSPPTVSDLVPDKASGTQVAGSATITWTCSASDSEGDSISYRFFVQAAGGSWSVVQDWSASNVWAWTPSAAGTFNVACHVRDGKPGHAGPTGWDDHREAYGYIVLPPRWTVLAYLDGDNNLEAFAIAKFLSMSQVGSSSNVNLLAELDRRLQYDPSYGDWTDTKRFFITKGVTPTPANAVQDLGEQNMGDPNTLSAFISWGVQNYPADRYLLILFDHGSGAVQMAANVTTLGILFDDTDADVLTTPELGQALSSGGAHINVIYLDACTMGGMEVGYQIASYADVMVASEEVGWAMAPDSVYSTFLTSLVSNPSMTSASLATIVVTAYADAWSGGSAKITCVAVDLAKFRSTGLVTATDAFAVRLQQKYGSYRSQIQSARSGTESFEGPYGGDSGYYIDLYDLADRVYNLVPDADLRNAASDVESNLAAAVIAFRQYNHANAHGLSIFFPDVQSKYSTYRITYMATSFAAATSWNEWLDAYYGAPALVSGTSQSSVLVYDRSSMGCFMQPPQSNCLAFYGDLTSSTSLRRLQGAARSP